MKRLIVFDLDGTLADSLLAVVKVSVISGGAWPQFEKQVVAPLRHDEWLKNLSLLPTCGTKFYRYGGCWEQARGEVIEDRGSQITFSALGQQAPWRKRRNGIRTSSGERRSREFLTR